MGYVVYLVCSVLLTGECEVQLQIWYSLYREFRFSGL
jgi:hypothetical protein